MRADGGTTLPIEKGREDGFKAKAIHHSTSNLPKRLTGIGILDKGPRLEGLRLDGKDDCIAAHSRLQGLRHFRTAEAGTKPFLFELRTFALVSG